MGPESQSLLIIDDDAETLDTMATYFRKRGYSVEAVFNGLDALKLLESRVKFDLIITDIVMPGVSGIGVISFAKKLLPDVPLVAVTGFGEHPEGLASEAAADKVIRKPIKYPDLLEIVSDLLRDKQVPESS